MCVCVCTTTTRALREHEQRETNKHTRGGGRWAPPPRSHKGYNISHRNSFAFFSKILAGFCVRFKNSAPRRQPRGRAGPTRDTPLFSLALVVVVGACSLSSVSLLSFSRRRTASALPHPHTPRPPPPPPPPQRRFSFVRVSPRFSLSSISSVGWCSSFCAVCAA